MEGKKYLKVTYRILKYEDYKNGFDPNDGKEHYEYFVRYFTSEKEAAKAEEKNGTIIKLEAFFDASTDYYYDCVSYHAKWVDDYELSEYAQHLIDCDIFSGPTENLDLEKNEFDEIEKW